MFVFRLFSTFTENALDDMNLRSQVGTMSPLAHSEHALHHSRRALVVDDEMAIRWYIREILEAEGFEVLEAENGGEAKHILDEKLNITLVVTDIVMPDIDGIELILKT